MTTDTSRKRDQTYVCANCKKEGAGLYVAGGWWRYPLGWFVHDNCDRWACSEVCAAGAGNAPPATPGE